jgi:hypothetical protein
LKLSLLSLVVALGSTQAHAAGELGVGLDAGLDLPDGVESGSRVRFGPGVGLRVPVRLSLTDSVAFRATAQALVAGGQDRVEWMDEGTLVYSDDHWSMLTATHLLVGPEIRLPGMGVSPRAGVDVGMVWAQNWHSFGGVTGELLDPAQNDLDDPGNIDPYTSQLRPAAGLHVGLGIPTALPFALDLEAGYVVSFLSSAALRKAGPELVAVRAPYGLNPLRVGAAVTFPFGHRP